MFGKEIENLIGKHEKDDMSFCVKVSAAGLLNLKWFIESVDNACRLPGDRKSLRRRLRKIRKTIISQPAGQII